MADVKRQRKVSYNYGTPVNSVGADICDTTFIQFHATDPDSFQLGYYFVEDGQPQSGIWQREWASLEDWTVGEWEEV